MNKEAYKNFWKDHWPFLCILLFAIILRLLYMSPGIRFNGTDLSLQAYNLINGLYDPNKIWFHFGIRYTMLLLVTLVYKFLGISEFTAFLTPFLSSITTIILVYFFGKTLFSKEVGLLAAYFLAILPIDIHNATVLETDGTMNVFAVLAMFLYYYFRVRQKSAWSFLFVGMLIAISALTKIFGVLVLFSLLLYEIITLFSKDERTIKTKLFSLLFCLLAIGFGFALVYTPVVLWQYSATGDPFYNIHVEKNLLFSLPHLRDWPKPDYDFIPPSNDHWSFPRFMFNPTRLVPFLTDYYIPDEENPMLNIFFYFVFAAIFYFLFQKLYKKEQISSEQKIFFLLCWFLAPLLFLQNYYFIWKVQRYLFITLVPAFLLAA